MLFIEKNWNKVLEKHLVIKEKIIERNKFLNTYIKEWNENVAPLIRQERSLREKLPTSTTKERIDLEAKINELINVIENSRQDEIENQMYNEIITMMNKEFTKKEIKIARAVGFEV